ncbi:MAG: hemolysin D [Planctomycetaceae bacterium]|nr:hemolysin D [Planctomycetaceae bacterium]
MSAGPTLTTATRRPIPLQIRDDLVFKQIEYQGVSYWVIKDPVGLKYFRLQPEQYHVLMLLDGKRNLEELRDALHERLPTVRLQLTDIQHLITDLHQKGLVFSNRYGQGASLAKLNLEQKKQKILTTMRSLLYIRLPGWDPEQTLQWMYPLVRWLYHPVTVTFSVLFVIASWILLAVQFEAFASQLPEFQQFFSWSNLMYLWITLGTCKVIHEFGHGLTCKHFGGECHGMGIMLLVFSPCLYCDVSDSWMLRNKWKRIMIGAAGMYIEVLISALAVFVWWNTKPGMIHHLCLNIFFVTTISTVVWNANPLMRFDGYYMMSDLLEIPNLRPKADRLLRDWFGWYCLGIEIKPDPFMPESGRAGFVIFAIAAGLYRWFILAAITIFLYTVLKPYGLQSIGIMLAVVSMTMIVFNLVLNIYKQVTAPRIEPLSRPKIVFSLGTLATLIVVGLAIPLPLHVEAMFLIEPHDVRHVYTATTGRLDTRPAQPGQQVQAGTTLAVLSNPDLELEETRLEQEEQSQIIRISVATALDDRAREELARARRQSIRSQQTEFQKQVDRLTITAPCAGTIIAPPRVAALGLEARQNQLSSWHGTPLEERNLHCFLPERTHLLSIAPDNDFQAVVLIDQTDRNDLISAEESLGFSGTSGPDGLTVSTVLPGSAADKAGLQPGDRIIALDQTQVTRLVDLLPGTPGDGPPRALSLQLAPTSAEGDIRTVSVAPTISPTRVELKFDHLPHRIYEGFVEKISRRNLEFVPELLSNKLGGEVPTVTDSQGRERLVSPSYQATVMLREDAPLLRTGLRGRSRFLVDTRTAYQWLYRWYRHTFKFRL